MPSARVTIACIRPALAWVAIMTAPLALPALAHSTLATADSAAVDSAAVDSAAAGGSDSVRTAPASGARGSTAGATIRGWPYPESRYFMLFSAGYMAPVSAPDHLWIDPGGKLALEFGMMVNIDRRWGIGISGHLESDGDFEETFGPMVRLRRWLTRSTCLDVGIGWLSPTSADTDLLTTDPQFAALVELQNANWISVFVPMETLKFVPEYSGWTSPPPSDGTVWYVGGRGHYLPGLLALVGILALASSSGT